VTLELGPSSRPRLAQAGRAAFPRAFVVASYGVWPRSRSVTQTSPVYLVIGTCIGSSSAFQGIPLEIGVIIKPRSVFSSCGCSFGFSG